MIIQFKWLFEKVLTRFSGLMILGFLFVKDRKNKVLINHEMIHVKQMVELLIVGFYVWYIIEFIIRLIQYQNWNTAYIKISLEREAYKNEMNLNYLRDRNIWRFRNYL